MKERQRMEREMIDLGLRLPTPLPSVSARLNPQQPAREYEIDPEKDCRFFGNDDRSRVTNSVAVPYRWICSLKIWHQDPDRNIGNFLPHYGTGVLISDREVLTAAHNIRTLNQAQSGIQHDSTAVKIEVVPALAGSTKPFGRYETTAFKIPRIYQDCMTSIRKRQKTESQVWWTLRAYDYGLLRLKDAIGQKKFTALSNQPLCFWGSPSCGQNTSHDRLEPSLLNGHNVVSFGYPGDKGNDQMWAAPGQLKNAYPRRRVMDVTIDGCKGQSGSPLCLTHNSVRYLVGILVAIRREREAPGNLAVRVTHEFNRQLEAWQTDKGW